MDSRVDGGRPATNAISRWAAAKRAMESTSSSTSAPCPLMWFAMTVAASAARARTVAGWSEVDTTTVERARPSG